MRRFLSHSLVVRSTPAMMCLTASLFASACNPSGDGTIAEIDTLVPTPVVVEVLEGSLLTSNGLCVDVVSGKATVGTKVDVAICGNSAAQTFRFPLDGQVTGAGGLCLDVDPSGQLELAKCNGSAAQSWALRGQHLVRKDYKCLTTSDAFPGVGSPAVLGKCDGGLDLFTLIDTPTALVGDDGHCLDIAGGSHESGALLDARMCARTSAQTFTFTAAKEIRTEDGRCLDVMNGDPSSQTVDAAACNGTIAQKWSLEGRAVRSFFGSYCLDLADDTGHFGNAKVGAPVSLEPCNGSPGQQWFENASYSEGMATLLVVTDDALSGTAQRLVDHKNATGMPAGLVTVEGLKAQFCGEIGCPLEMDGATVVKRGIDYGYRYRGTKYVFLAGDSTHVPVRHSTVYSAMPDAAGAPTMKSFVSSDSYYENLYHHAAGSDIAGAFSTWNSTLAGPYNEYVFPIPASEYNPDNVDGYPDIAVGRLDVNASSDLENYITKVITYETKTMAFTASVSFFEDEPYPGASSDATTIASEFPASYTKTFHAFEQGKEALPSGWIDGSASDTTNAAAESGWMVYIGHGGPAGWGYNSYVVGTGDVDAMTQTDTMPIVFAAACETGSYTWDYTNFDVIPMDTPPPPAAPFDAFSNHWLATNDHGGGIAYAGETVVLPDDIATAYFGMVLARFDAGERTLGDAWHGGRQEFWYTYLGTKQENSNDDSWPFREPRIYFEIMPLFGDPSLRIQRGAGPVL